jgi:amino-acid N-acetyltransferase
MIRRVMKATTDNTITPAAPADGPAIASMLRAADLPYEDIAPHLGHFFVARKGGVVVGAVGLEVHGPDGLLRSLGVAPAYRGHGLGDELVRRLERAAAEWGVAQLWLLTTTAEAFFARRGFRVTPRTAVPTEIAATHEFKSLCPSTAICMTRARAEAKP